VENYSFSDLITFSRTTNATLVDGTGRVTYAPNNLFTNSEAFDAGFWFKSNATVTANVTAAPNGTTTADAIIENTATATHGVNGSVSVTAGVSYALSVYAKQNGRSLLRTGSATTGKYAVFDLNAGVVQYVDSGVSASITSVGNGWYRCTATQPETATGSTNFIFRTQSNTSEWPGTGQYTGNGVSGVFLWGAQVEAVTYQTTAGTYNSTSPPNLLGFTQEFENAAYIKVRSSISSNAISAPNGTFTADKLVEDSTATSTHLIQLQGGFSSFVSGTTYVISGYAKAGERTSASISMGTDGGVFAGQTANFNFSTGVISAQSGVATFAMTDAGNGWYRWSITAAAAASGAGTIRFSLIGPAGGVTYTGDGSSGLFIWGAQLSNSASVDPYVYNPAAAPTSTAYYGPRFDYNPTTLSPLGLLIEEQRVNSIRNSIGVGAVAGTPGTAPTNWSVSTSGSGITREIVGTGMENGISYIDIKFFGTPTASAALSIGFEGVNNIAATSGQTWADSAYVKLQAGSFAGAETSINILGTNGAAGTESFGSANITSTPSNLAASRLSLTATLANASTTFVQPRVRIGVTNGVPFDITLRIGLPQMELGAFSTSVIPTVASTVTRAADIAVMSGSNFSSWYSQGEGTIVASWSTTSVVVPITLGVFGVSDGSSNERTQIRRANATNDAGFIAVDGGVVQYSGSITASSGINTSALAYKVNDFIGANNGTLGSADTSGTLPTPTQAEIGFGQALTYLNGHIRSITFYPYRLADFQLQAITA
jgi:hypothetical protein